ncbi:unnamed protein product [Allacma fusca]|uniref:Uncharacterized protein n=1 Tax=Allacma fusca TaxID=39272 RepID=A0A8J2KKL1_9HEXA|nr:unnamed protein product [Allacma fusca]
MCLSKIIYFCFFAYFMLMSTPDIVNGAEDPAVKVNGGESLTKIEAIQNLEKSLSNGPQQDCQSSLRDILLLLQSINSTLTEQNSAQESFVPIGNKMDISDVTGGNLTGNIFGSQSSVGTVTFEIKATQEAFAPVQDEFQNAEGKVLRRPHAVLYTGDNLTGNYEHYDFQTPTYKGGCFNLHKHEGKIKSVDTEGSCVRLFSGSGCRIWSQAIYPGVDVSVDPKLRGVMSIGPCVQNEFEHVIQEPWNSSHITIQKIPSKLRSYANIPDIIPDYFTYSGTTAVYFNSIPVYSYRLGDESRLEALAGSFHIRHMRNPEEAEANRITGLKQSFYEELALNPETDEPGYAFPLELGGPADKRYNVFPQNKLQAAKYRAEIVPEIKNFLDANPENYVRLTVNFFYENSTTTRPSGMWYLMFKDGLNEITYGYVPNSN